MSWQAMKWAIEKGKDYELDSTTRYVALILGNFEGPDGIFPSLSTLELYTGLSERQIRRCIKKLIAVGLLDYGDQTVVSENPRYRNDQLPKVYTFLYEPPARPDLSKVGRVPKRKTPWARKPKAGPVDNRPAGRSRPDTQSRTPGQTGGLDVHQSFNPRINPSAHAEPPAEPIDYDAVRRLREACRARLADRGVLITEPLFALA